MQHHPTILFNRLNGRAYIYRCTNTGNNRVTTYSPETHVVIAYRPVLQTTILVYIRKFGITDEIIIISQLVDCL